MFNNLVILQRYYNSIDWQKEIKIFVANKIKTSENELSRIAINFLLEDYKANGETSILAKVLASLLA